MADEKSDKPAAEKPKAAASPQGAPPSIDFTGFVLSLAQSALIDLGAAPHPDREETVKDLVQAKQTIDILALLQQKTAGNLTSEEAKLLDGVLYQLRITFVDAK